ncbi:unnamed protein product, partial [Prorocentrum cordatum]
GARPSGPVAPRAGARGFGRQPSPPRRARRARGRRASASSAGAMQVRPGDRVTIHGLTGRPELNGQSAVLVGPAGNDRVTVRLDSGAEVALKQANLGIPAPGGGGGVPGGMPGGGGMPQMPSSADVAAAAEQALARMGIRLPPGVSALQAAGGALVACFGALYVLGRFVPKMAIALAGLAAVAALALGQSLLPRGGGHAQPASGHQEAYAEALREAYQQGYDDGLAGRERRNFSLRRHIVTPQHEPAAPTGGGGGFGMGSVMRYIMVAGYVYRAGAGPGGFSLQSAIANIQANPMQGLMMVSMLSGMFF